VLSHKLHIGYSGVLYISPKITPFHGPIPKPNYPPHSWTHPTYLPKLHPYSISHFATMLWTDTQTDQQMVGGKGMFDYYRLLSLYREWHMA